MNPEELNKLLQKDATELLESTQLLNKLEQFGRVVLGGSFVYGTMVDEDIDMSVIVNPSNLSFSSRKTIMNILLDIAGLDGISMTDRHQNRRDGIPNGIWFGPIINYKSRKWHIDIWLVTQDEPYTHHNMSLHYDMKNITENQRNIILDIKHQAFKLNLKKQGVTSSDIYKAVLKNNIKSFEEFLLYNNINSTK